MASAPPSAVSTKEPPSLRSPAEVDPRTALLLVPGGGGSDERSGYAVPRGPALLAVTSSFLSSLSREDDGSGVIVVPCPRASRLAVRLATWYIAHYATQVADRPHAPWLLPRPFEEKASAVPQYTSVFEQAVFGCIQRAGAAVACQVLHVAAFLQAPGLGLLAGVALHLASSVEEALSLLLADAGSDDDPDELCASDASNSDHVFGGVEIDYPLDADPRGNDGIPRCPTSELPSFVAMDGPELERPSQLSAIDELPTSVKAFYLPFVPGLRVKVVVPPSVEGSSEDVLLATTSLLERGASWPSFAEIEWHRSCTVQGSFVRLMRTYEHVRNFWIWGDGCSVHLDVRELQDVRAIPDGWSVVFTASDPTTLSKLSGEALLQVCEKAKSVDLRSLELERMPSCHSGNYSCQEQRQLNCHLLAPASLRSIGSDASPYFASTSKLDLSHCNELVSIERDSLSQFRGPEVVLPRSIVSLGAGVFSNPSLTHLDLSHCVALTAIPARCFACTEGLTKLLLPNTIEFVGSSAFSECCASIGLSTCEALSCANCDAFSGFRGADLLLPNTIEIIDSSAFSGCCASVDLSACKSLSCIANSAFDDFSGAELRLPASIDTIGHAAFRSCQCAIIDLSACSKLSAIPDHCFAGADHVETVLLPPSIAIIGCSAFEGTERLEELHLPTSCHTVGWKAFSQCGANLDLSACGKLSHIGGHAFGGFRGDALRLPASTTIETIEWTTYSECCASVDLSTWEGLSCVGPSAFADFRGANLLLPNTIEIIDNNAFSGCSASVDLTACDALSCIGANVFEGFRGAELRLPNTIVRIEQQAFSRCKASVDLSACESLTSIGDSAFEDFSGAELRLPASIDTLGVAAFKACQCSAIDLSQCSKLTAIPDRCFMKCGSMVRLPPGVSSVGKFAFAGCTTSVDLSACHDVSELREGTFSDFAGPELRLPAIDKIGDDAFSGFQRRGRSLPSDKSDFTLDLSSWTNVTEIPHHCFANGNFARILLPTTITTVGVEAFSHCSASVDFTVCSISDVGEGAFSGYKGSTVDLSHCTGLEKIPFKCFNGAVCDAILLPPGVKTIEWCACIDCTPAVDLSLCSLNTNHGFDRKPDDGSHTAFDFFNR